LPFEGIIPVRMLNFAEQLPFEPPGAFRVLGTVRSPTIQIRPLPILGDEGIASFLRGRARSHKRPALWASSYRKRRPVSLQAGRLQLRGQPRAFRFFSVYRATILPIERERPPARER